MLGRLCRLTCQVVHEMNGRHSDGFPIDVEIAEELPDEGPGTTPGYIAWPGAAGLALARRAAGSQGGARACPRMGGRAEDRW